MDAPVAKTCRRCGRDCSSLPRVRDGRGGYTCRECLESAPSAAAPPSPGGAYALEPGPEEAAVGGACPACGRPMGTGAVICIACGFDKRKGFQPGTGAGATATRSGLLRCPRCDYDLRGLRTPNCPECGLDFATDIAKVRRDQISRETRRHAYLRPLSLGAVGVGLSGLILALSGRVQEIPPVMLGLLAAVPIALAVYLICCAAWIGFNSTMTLAGARLFGVLALMLAMWELASLLPVPLYALIFVFILFAILLGEEMELDRSDAWLVALFTGVALIAAGTLAPMLLAP